MSAVQQSSRSVSIRRRGIPTEEPNGAPVYAPREGKCVAEKDLVQFEVPDFTLRDLLSAIPKHCYERSTLYSSLYVVSDVLQTLLLVFVAKWLDEQVPSLNVSTHAISANSVRSLARFSIWVVYGFLQGLTFTGIWVIAHECGHQAYSTSKFMNNTVRWVLHSALLVPYHSWRISHGRHHAATSHMERDEVFVPRIREQYGRLPLIPPGQSHHVKKSTDFGPWLAELLEDMPLYNLLEIVIQQLLGWPLYLFFNVSGQPRYPTFTNHFNPNSIIFDKKQFGQIIVSDLGILATLSALVAWANLSPGGWGEVARYYIVPYLWTNHWLVMITYLQHTDPLLPHYSGDLWTYPRGALCTIDRQWLGPIGAYFFHGISETHVLHHVCSKIPHYHAWEATEALKLRIGKHYHSSDENVFVSLWKTVRNCRFVEDEPVVFYRNADGVPRCVAVMPGYGTDSGVALSE